MGNTVQHVLHLVIFIIVLIMSLVTIIREREVVNTDCDHEHHGFAFVAIALVTNLLAVACFAFIPHHAARKVAASSSFGSALSNFFSGWRCSAQSAKEMLLDVAFFCCFLWAFVVTTGLSIWGIILLVDLGTGTECKARYEEGKLCDVHGGPLSLICESTSLYGLVIIHTCLLLMPLFLSFILGLILMINQVVRTLKRSRATRGDAKSGEDNEATPLLETA
ncbi:hypothetical protein QOT17_024089 [Balamuthia mandrillaris]